MSETTAKDKKRKRSLKSSVESILWTIFVVLLIRQFLLQAYNIPTGSMEDTLLPGDFLLVVKFIYGFEIPYTNIRFLNFYKPGRGEIVVFPYPVTMRKDFVKRCVALPGDTVQIINKQLYINGKPVDEPYVVHKDTITYPPLYTPNNPIAIEEYTRMWINRKFIKEPRVRDNFGPVVVPPGTIFVMGDNRDYSFDSRFWGPVPLNYVKGKPFIIYFSWNPGPPLIQFWKKIRWNRMLRLVIWS